MIKDAERQITTCRSRSVRFAESASSLMSVSRSEQLSRRKRRLRDERNFVGCVGFHSSTQPTDPCTQGEIWIGSKSICDPEQIRYIDLAFIRCGASVGTIYSN